jgi:hypothetical protein
MTADGQQQLMLSGRDPRVEQALVVAIGGAFGHPSALRYRATIS